MAQAGRVMLAGDAERREGEKTNIAMLNIATLRCLRTARCLYGSWGQKSSTKVSNDFETLTRAVVKLGRHVTHRLNSERAIIGGL